MADNTEKRTGALHSELKIELHSHYAIGLWQGRRAEKGEEGAKGKPAIMGMPRFLSLASRINQDSLKNNPWADAAMLALEEKISGASRTMSALINSLDSDMELIPTGVTFTEPGVSAPLDIKVFSNTPLGYRCVYLLIGFDQFSKKVLQASHYALISRTKRDQLLSEGGRLIRQIYGSVISYRSLAVSRLDAVENNAVWQQAVLDLGEPDVDVLLGNRRSAFSPPVNEASVNLLRMRHRANHNAATK
ncbi:TIGR03761 family integrating conjugative element protein [Rahnella sp. BCC 1045]|uniref:PFL_4669 family integrating conjugative element protein n=1 Tax=Rahnella sp. BCC 1045 TaxID=2816251 RepID=UPI001C27356C|nr:TIGR03761 family integrating conjugative element protein [Rahnella sp. BCC 1045]MBU9819858.1 TIGR03761 family integrating conjugative element protein [Rahnella sp. BCC 1045]